jgi:hypothetical protein
MSSKRIDFGSGQAAPATVGNTEIANRQRMAQLRSLAVSVAVGATVGAIIGGTLGRVAMRLVLVADGHTRGFETAAGATVGEITAAGTVVVYAAGLVAGAALGLTYFVARPFLPERAVWRAGLSTLAATLLGTALIVSDGRADFAFVPEAVSIVLIAVGFALTALTVTLVVDRLTPSGRRAAPRVAVPIVTGVLLALLAFAALRVADALNEVRLV